VPVKGSARISELEIWNKSGFCSRAIDRHRVREEGEKNRADGTAGSAGVSVHSHYRPESTKK